jgi:hypothetical protein
LQCSLALSASDLAVSLNPTTQWLKRQPIRADSRQERRGHGPQALFWSITNVGIAMNKLVSSCMGLVLACSAVSAQADCAYPQAPAAVPNGAAATEAEMISAMQAFKAYDAQVVSYGKCLDEETQAKVSAAGSDAGQVMQLKTIQKKKHNSAVTELQTRTKDFNEQVRIFKAKG